LVPKSSGPLLVGLPLKSFLSHVINKHDNLDDPLYNRCNHGEIKDRTWLEKGSVIVELHIHDVVPGNIHLPRTLPLHKHHHPSPWK